MKVDIPLTGNDLDTDDPAESGKSLAAAVMGFLALFGVVGAASYIYNRTTELAGMSGETDVPGI